MTQSPSDRIGALRERAESHSVAGEWALAAQAYREALDALVRRGGDDTPVDRIGLLLGLASTLLTLRDEAAAEAVLLEARALAEAGGDAFAPVQLQVLNGLAALHAAQENRAALEETAMAWRSLAHRFPPADEDEAVEAAGQGARILTRLGSLCIDLDKPDEAIRWLTEARDIALAVGELQDVRPAFYYLAIAHMAKGNAADAENNAIAALARVSADELMHGDPGADAVMSLVGHFAWKRGAYDAAILLRKCALAQSHALEDQVTRHRSATFTRHPPDWYRDLMNMLVAQGRLIEAATVRRSLEEAELFALINRTGPLDPRRTMTTLTPREARWRRELCTRLDSVRAARLRLVGRGATPNGRAALKRRIFKAETQLRGWIRSLRDTTASEAAIEARALLALARRPVPPDTLVVNSITTEARLVLQLNRAEVSNFLIWSVPMRDLAQHVFAFRSTIDRGDTDLDAHATHFMGLLGLSRLHEFSDLAADPTSDGFRVLKGGANPPPPMPQGFEGPRHILFNLDGPLRHLPIAALGDEHGLLIERAAITMAHDAPSTAALGVRRVVDPAAAGGAPRIAAFGTTAAHRGFPALPGVRAEIATVVQSPETPRGAFPGTAHLDANFTREALAEAAHRYPMLHIASHFEFHATLNRASGLLLGDGSILTLDELEDGGYNFSGVRLVTLSACETGVSGSEAGRDLMSLASVIRQLGAGGVVATLWRVPDEGTARLMGPFYRGLAAGLDVAEALRRAQLDVLGLEPRAWSEPTLVRPANGAGAHPLGWAGVVYITGCAPEAPD